MLLSGKIAAHPAEAMVLCDPPHSELLGIVSYCSPPSLVHRPSGKRAAAGAGWAWEAKTGFVWWLWKVLYSSLLGSLE